MKNKEPNWMERNPDNYKWGMFYYNAQDERVVVPKINPGLGWTFNFARPSAYLLLIGIMAIIALGALLVQKYG